MTDIVETEAQTVPDELAELEDKQLIADYKEEIDQQNTVESVIESLGGTSSGDITLKVYKINAKNNKQEFCFNASHEEITT